MSFLPAIFLFIFFFSLLLSHSHSRSPASSIPQHFSLSPRDPDHELFFTAIPHPFAKPAPYHRVHRSFALLPDALHPMLPIDFSFALRHSVSDRFNNSWELFESHVLNISNPESSLYQQYLTADELSTHLSPNRESIEKLTKFLKQFQPAEIILTKSKDFLQIRGMPVKMAELLFHTEFRLFQHNHSKRKLIRSFGPLYKSVELLELMEVSMGIHDFFESEDERKGIREMNYNANHDKLLRSALKRRMEGKSSIQSNGKSTSPFDFNSVHPRPHKTFTQPEDCGSNAPDMIFNRILRGSHSHVKLSRAASIYCFHGQKTSDLSRPCADFLPLAVRLDINVTSIPSRIPILNGLYNANLDTTTAPPQERFHVELTCDITSKTLLECFNSVAYKLPYRNQQLYVTAQTFYEDGNVSAIYDGSAFPYSPTEYVVPARLASLYSIPPGLRGTNSSNSQSVVQFKTISFMPDDLTLYQQWVGLEPQEAILEGYNDPLISGYPSAEGTLDVQIIMGLAPGVRTFYWGMDPNITGPAHGKGGSHGAFVLEWAMEMSNFPEPPLVNSLSYGDVEEAFFDRYGNWDYLHRFEKELQKMAARGLTVLFATGDAGVSNVGEAGNDIGPLIDYCTPFQSFYPSSSSWVTAVSSTFLFPRANSMCNYDFTDDPVLTHAAINFAPIDCEDPNNEIAVSVRDGSHWTTGGGFSNLTNNYTPQWQRSFVNDFLYKNSADLPPETVPTNSVNNAGGRQMWNRNARGYPDISAVGQNHVIVMRKALSSASGTSASTPVVAAMMSLINDELLNRGLPPVGFVNPMLYLAKTRRPTTIKDIVRGSNFDGDPQPRCSTYATICPYGFYTSPSWNPVTGLGTPNFMELRDFIVGNAETARAIRQAAGAQATQIPYPFNYITAQDAAGMAFGIAIITHFLLVVIMSGCSRFYNTMTGRFMWQRNVDQIRRAGSVELDNKPAGNNASASAGAAVAQPNSNGHVQPTPSPVNAV